MALNFNISKIVFLEALNALQNLTSKRGTLAIISNILIETDNDILNLTATDLEVGLKIKIPAEIKNSGSITLPSKKIYEIVRESGSSSINIEETENSWVIIHAGLSTYNLAGMPSNEFPEFPFYNEDTFVAFEAHVFSELIDKIIYSIANEQENNYVLTSVLFEKEKKNDKSYIRMISSDGHRLSIMEKDVAADVDNITLNRITLIPKKGIQELKKFCENRDTVQISFEEKQMIVKDDHATMVIRLKQGEFPPYRAIVDAVQLKNKIQINRVPFLESLKRINLFTEDIFHTIQLEITNEKMILSSQNADIGNAKDEQAINYNGESLTLGFNCRFFIETLQVMECETVDAYINSNNSPCLLKSDFDEGFLSIIMPMQL
ncbi:MAG: DNA polymerase III subunit beta [Pseudomonadota bacterium]